GPTGDPTFERGWVTGTVALASCRRWHSTADESPETHERLFCPMIRQSCFELVGASMRRRSQIPITWSVSGHRAAKFRIRWHFNNRGRRRTHSRRRGFGLLSARRRWLLSLPSTVSRARRRHTGPLGDRLTARQFL